VLFRVLGLEVLLSKREEAGELSQVVEGHGLHRVKIFLTMGRGPHLQDFDENIDALQVVSFVEVDKRGLPEFLGVHTRPGELASLNLLLPLFERRKLVIVLVEELEQAL